jgi:RNA polymerase sigma-70 factor (ECF subfamily)
VADRSVDEAVDEVVRTSYGRLVAYLASVTGDLASAEDALSDAFVAALRTWPERGIPDRPVSWMITAARRSAIGRARRADVAARAAPTLALLAEESAVVEPSGEIPDRRLELLYACAHPAIDRSVHAPLMLQTVFGLDVARMSEVFVVPAATLGQRLVRAKRKIRDASIGFRIPEGDELPPRTGAVLDAVYAAYGTGWEDPLGIDPGRRGLSAEAVRLADLVAELRPDDGEALGLAALVHHFDARMAARRDDAGRFVALGDQDVAKWSRGDVERGDALLAASMRTGSIGPYQLHAAIQSVHNRRIDTGVTAWNLIANLYDALVRLSPTLGVQVARAAAHLEAYGVARAEEVLAAVDRQSADRYQPYWVLQAEIATRSGDTTGAERAMANAMALTTEPSVREYLAARAT